MAIYGSLTIAATTPIRQFPQLEGSKPQHGNHTQSRTRGLFSTLELGDRWAAETVALPQRNKYMTVTVLADKKPQSEHTALLLKEKLADLDSRFDGARQLYKLHRLLLEVDDELVIAADHGGYAAVINNLSEHATFTLMSSGKVIHLTGIFDAVNSSVRLAWTTEDGFIEEIRRADPTRYVFYRFPPIVDRPVFIYTQLVCSKWYSWTKAFTGTDGLSKAMNALEVLLYKDPSIDSL
jgi:hypothetical protein